MKVIFRALKSFWFALPLLWLVGMLLCWFVLPRWLPQRESVLAAMALFSAFCLLLVVLRQYRRIRAERNIENLVQLEVDRSAGAGGEFRDSQVLQQRLKHTIALLRASRAAGGGGKAALYDLPWYLVVGMSASGKTSLLTRSGLSASIAGQSAAQSGTQHCDWYFSPEAVLIDTAGRYLTDDQSAQEFADFLKLLRRQRRKPAINGLVLVVSLPGLLAASHDERGELAERLAQRIQTYSQCLGVNPPIYLMLSKVDLLPGFSQAFDALDASARQQPLGITFGLGELRQLGLRGALQDKFGALLASLEQHVGAQIDGLGGRADASLLQFPRYLGELSGLLGDFLESFESAARQRTPAVLRGLYFTSALQTDQVLPPLLEEVVAEHFALDADAAECPDESLARRIGERSYFITDTFRRVIFPDRDLSLYYSRLGKRKALAPSLLAVAVLAGGALAAWQGWSFANNRAWLDGLRAQLGGAGQDPAQDLELLRTRLAEVDNQRQNGVPLRQGAGLYAGDDLRAPLQRAYLEQLQRQALEPVGRELQRRLRNLDDFAQSLGATTSAPAEAGRAGKDQGRGSDAAAAALRQARQGNAAAAPNLGGVPRSVGDLGSRLRGEAGSRLREAARDARRGALAELAAGKAADASGERAAAAGLSLSEEVLDRLDEHQVASLIEAYDALKLYLILTRPEQHADADFVAAALPRAWERAQAGEGGDKLDSAVVRANSAMYVRYLRAGEAPALRRNEELVAEARQNLKSFMRASSLVDREYLRLQLEADRQFPALTLNDLVPLPGRNLLYSSEAIPALYSRQGWEQFLRPELIKLLSGDLRNESDWVLDGEGSDGLVQKANFMRELMARYKADYAEVWMRFLAGTGVRQFGDMQGATRQLSLYSDVQNSPLKLLLAAVDRNTSWDQPEKPAQKVASAVEDSFWTRVKGVFGDDAEAAAKQMSTPLPKVDDGSLAKRFEPVARLFARENPEGADSTVMDRYLASLRRLKVRLANVQRSQDVGKSSKALISETLEGGPSEFAGARNYVETSIDTSQGGLSASLQKLFIAPLQYSWDSLREPAGEQIAQAWTQQIARPWNQVLAHRYPIAPGSANEASVKDLQRFVDPQSGLLPAFKRNEIGNLSGGEGLGMGNGQQAPLVDPRLVSGIDRASSLGEVIASLSDRDNGFEVMLEPSGAFTDIVFTLDGQEQHYRNGRSSWSRFAWPGSTSTPGARLDVVTLSGQRLTVFDYPGRWGLLKMSESARVSNVDEVQQRFTWNTGAGNVSLLVRNYGGVKMTDLANVKALGSLGQAGRL